MDDYDSILPKETNVDAVTVSSKVLEEIIGVSARRVRQLAEEGILIRASKGRYKLKESVKNYILTLKVTMDSASPGTVDGELNLEEEKAMHEKVKRHISELKLQLMKGEVHKADDVRAVMTDMILAAKAKLLGIPSKLAPILVMKEDKGNIKDIINKEILEALNELKDYKAEEFYGDDYLSLNDDDYEDEEYE